jgi:hypothetical protein
VILRFVLWSLADTTTSLDEIRARLPDEVDGAEDVPGLRLKVWVSDEATDRFGAVELWESREAAELASPGELHDVIGKRPDAGEELEVEATIEGRFAIEGLSRRGTAYGE